MRTWDLRLRGFVVQIRHVRPNTTGTYTVVRSIRLYDRITTAIARYDTSTDSPAGYGALVTTVQLPNCITAARESRRNFGIARQAGTISPEGYHGPVVLLDTSAFRVPGSQSVGRRRDRLRLSRIDLDFSSSIRLDYVPGNAASSRTIDHLRRTSTQDVRRRTDCYFNTRAFSYKPREKLSVVVKED